MRRPALRLSPPMHFHPHQAGRRTIVRYWWQDFLVRARSMHIVHVIVDIAYLHMSVSAVQFVHGVHVYASVLCTCMQNIVYTST